MAKTSLTNFVVSMNRRFRRSKFPFEKSLRLRFHDAAECCLSYFKIVLGSEGISSWMFGVRDALLAILVQEPVRLTNRLPGNPELVGGQLINTPYSQIVTTRAPWLPPPERSYSAHLISQILLEAETDRIRMPSGSGTP